MDIPSNTTTQMLEGKIIRATNIPSNTTTQLLEGKIIRAMNIPSNTTLQLLKIRIYIRIRAEDIPRKDTPANLTTRRRAWGMDRRRESSAAALKEVSWREQTPPPPQVRLRTIFQMSLPHTLPKSPQEMLI